MYEPIIKWDRVDAKLFNLHEKFIGLAKVFRQQGNFGSKPVVELLDDDITFLSELGLLAQKAVAVIVTFRNKVCYWKIDQKELDSCVVKEKEVRGKKDQYRIIPINYFKAV